MCTSLNFDERERIDDAMTWKLYNDWSDIPFRMTSKPVFQITHKLLTITFYKQYTSHVCIEETMRSTILFFQFLGYIILQINNWETAIPIRYICLIHKYNVLLNEFANIMIKSRVVVKHHFMAMFHIHVLS